MQIERLTERPSLPFARATRARSLSRLAIIAFVALACAALVSACGGSSSSKEPTTATIPVNTARVAKSIENTLIEKRKIHATVVCPQTAPTEVGATFECTATYKAAKAPHATIKAPFVVTVQNSKGYVTYVGK